MSSTFYCCVNAIKLVNKMTFNLNCRERIRQSKRKIKYRASRYLTLFSCKSEDHIANYCNYKLSTDIEKDPGPLIYVDPKKTIAAPYCQGNELVFGQNAGQQCVAMSFQIMNIGNQFVNENWKSSLSRLARQVFLMQSELSTALNAFDTDYQLEYSESYPGTVHQETSINGYQYEPLYEEPLSHSYLKTTPISY